MSRGINKVILVGHVGRDPELRYTGSGKAVANFSLATNENYGSRDGERHEHTEWHKIVIWGGMGEASAQHLKKGSLVFVEGRIRSREWEDKQGQKRTSFEVHAIRVTFLDRRNGENHGSNGNANGHARGRDSFESDANEELTGSSVHEIQEEDIPF